MDFIGPDAFVETSGPPPLPDDEIHLWLFPQWTRSSGGTANAPHVRGLLAGYLNVPPDALKIEQTASGKPFVVGEPIRFNISHSGGTLLLAVSLNQALGVDVETSRRQRPVLELAERFFAPAEADALRAMPQAFRQQAFLDLWSCKEAVLKAHGAGIRFGLHRITFELDSKGGVSRLLAIDSQAGAASQWHLARLAPLTQSTGALAWRGAPKRVRAFTTARA